MKEYCFENRRLINVSKLKIPRIPRSQYKDIHKKIIIPCHDIIIEYKGGALLVIRKNYPAKDILWPIGGRLERGMNTEDSLRRRVKEECSLELENITELGCARTFFKTDPFGHGKGTDTINFMYFGRGKGRLKLDELHTGPNIILPKQYTKEFRKTLHPYVRDFMDLAMPLI
jgi:ADP-ribose pyrophosphatase YjhB (NUDIX family)